MAAEVGDEHTITAPGKIGGVPRKLLTVGGKAMTKDDGPAITLPEIAIDDGDAIGRRGRAASEGVVFGLQDRASLLADDAGAGHAGIACGVEHVGHRNGRIDADPHHGQRPAAGGVRG